VGYVRWVTVWYRWIAIIGGLWLLAIVICGLWLLVGSVIGGYGRLTMAK